MGNVPELVGDAKRALIRAFGERGAPIFAVAAPGRVNIIGDHTDYSGGFVLPCAIDRHCVAVGRLNERGVVRALAATIGESCEYKVGERPPRGHWASYVCGGLHEAFAALGAEPMGVDVALSADLPLGAGLSSSAAVEVAAATLVEQLVGRELGADSKARACRKAEHEWAGVPCGIMDQMVVCKARAGHALLIDCESEASEHIPIPAEFRFVAINSGVRHALAGGEYAARRHATEAAARVLGVPSLRHATTDDVDRVSRERPDLLGFVRHVVTENARVLEACEAMRTGDATRLGALMSASHASLRDDFRVSCNELDILCELLRDRALGARMTGGGFGGCVIALLDPDSGNHAENLAAVRREYRTRTGFECEVIEVRASCCTRECNVE